MFFILNEYWAFILYKIWIKGKESIKFIKSKSIFIQAKSLERVLSFRCISKLILGNPMDIERMGIRRMGVHEQQVQLEQGWQFDWPNLTILSPMAIHRGTSQRIHWLPICSRWIRSQRVCCELQLRPWWWSRQSCGIDLRGLGKLYRMLTRERAKNLH